MNEECLPGVTQWAKDFNRLVEEIASTDANVLISGEAGTERVFIARLLISKSKANCLPSLAFNCSKPPKATWRESRHQPSRRPRSQPFSGMLQEVPYVPRA